MKVCPTCKGTGQFSSKFMIVWGRRRCADCQGVGFLKSDDSFISAQNGDAHKALDIVNKLRLWHEFGWEYIIRNEKNGESGHFVQLGVYPIGCKAAKFISAQGLDLLDAMEMAEELGKQKMSEWECSEIPLDKLYKTEDNEITLKETENGESTVKAGS